MSLSPLVMTMIAAEMLITPTERFKTAPVRS
jgi:hypothetical protein